MIRELYYKKADAMKAAEEFKKLWGGWLGNTTADDRTEFTYEDDAMQKMCWAGEIRAAEARPGCSLGGRIRYGTLFQDH